ncbi:MAG: hypothetical protein Q7S66_01695 [bacterium]|nr:hypothetical protein [bacterium]
MSKTLQSVLEAAIAANGGNATEILKQLLEREPWQNGVGKRLVELSVAEGSVFVLSLDQSPGMIARLIAEAGYEGYVNPAITDTNYKVAAVAGVVPVRFRLVPGSELKRASDGYVWRADTEARFREMGLRFPNAVQALLPPAKNHGLGRGGKPYVAFVEGSGSAFYVDEDDRRRYLYCNDDDDWFSRCEFVGVVCE